MVNDILIQSQVRNPNEIAVLTAPVLVLNQNYEPLNVCSTRRALVLTLTGKAEVLEISDIEVRSPSTIVECPSVIRLQYLVRRPRRRVPLTRREIFVRDHHTCQYCGVRTRDLTLDHIIPRSKGGRHAWDNLVSACYECNHKKGQRTPDQAKMRLRSVPREPRPNPYAVLRRFTPNGELVAEWQPYLPG
jgi:5-methylcytosine-specific restriction endonuclease McrA